MATNASRVSEAAWIADLNTLLVNARVRFPDIVWKATSGELIYGHKMFVYSRAAGTFQHRYLGPAQIEGSSSHLSLSFEFGSSQSFNRISEENYLDPLQYLPTRPNSSTSVISNEETTSGVLQPLSLTGTEPAFFQACLEFLYTGTQGMETVFSVLFDGFEGDASDGKEGGIQRLRQDLLYAWRSKLFADVHLVLDDGTDNPTSFASHRAILASRSPYFHALLLGSFEDSKNQEFHLPPLFTPASTNFILGWIYSGTLEFSERTFDLTTALEIWRGADYLSLNNLQLEVEIKIERMMNLKRAARILHFALSPEVNCNNLQKAAAIVIKEHFGEIWNSPAIGTLEFHQQKSLVEDVCVRVSAGSVTAIAKDSFSLRKKLELESRKWAIHVGAMLDAIDERIKECLGTCVAQVVISAGFIDLIDGVGFSTDALAWLLELIVAAATEENAGIIYQALVGSVLLREEGILADAKLLCDAAKTSVMRYIKLRWLGIRASRGFDKLELWCLNEISDELKVSVDELKLGSPKPSLITSRTGLKVTVKRSTVADLASTRITLASRAADRAASIVLRSQSNSTPTIATRTPLSLASSRLASSARGSPSTPSAAQGTPSRIIPSSATPRLRQKSTTARVVTEILREPITKASPRLNGSPPKPSRALPALPTSNPVASSSKTVLAPRPPLVTRSSTITRRTSLSSVRTTASTTSVSVTARPIIPKTPATPRVPTPSTASRISTASRNSTVSKSPPLEKRPTSATSIRSSAIKRPLSVNSSRSKLSTGDSVQSIPPLPLPVTKSRSTPTPTQSLRKVGSSPVIRSKPIEVITLSKGKAKALNDDTPSKPRLTAKSEPPAKLSLPFTLPPTLILPGSKLLYGIPCIVTIEINQKSIKFKAVVKYIGKTFFAKEEELIGIEIYLTSLPEEVKLSLDFTDGVVEGIKYFGLGEEEEEMSRSCTPLSGRESLGLSVTGLRRGRRLSGSEMGEGESRGLFVRPNQIVYVL